MQKTFFHTKKSPPSEIDRGDCKSKVEGSYRSPNRSDALVDAMDDV